MQDKITKIINLLKKNYPITFFSRQKPFNVLISTILSQRTRDENTIKASKKLFLIFPTAEKIANANLSEIKNLIKESGFYNVKAKRIKEVSRILLEKYNGKVPHELDKLLNLPGVGRKTANCVLVYGFNIPAIPADTHVHRISNRLGIVKTKTPEQTEHELMKKIPRKYWIKINEMFVRHGQTICSPIKPKCDKCPISKLCKKLPKDI
ncbi:MAG: endonuclease III [Nanoarchaeota archaeon]|nr:endonuclease III [Nanoarchaeota archaeon]MBU4283690.1 endonuclease III [Nanoarchaeota archaeon]MBU4493337.1 endonuclease III [Nanoarchaeota archaeon]